MHTIKRITICGALAVLASCTTTTSIDPETDPSIGNEQLGVAEFETTETFDRLDIIGLDADHAVVARVTLQVRDVTLAEEGIAGLGREFSVEVRAQSFTHESVGLSTLSFPAPEHPDFAELLYDPYVSHLLALRGVGFQDRFAPVFTDDTVDYGHNGSCAAFVPGCSGSGATGCCLDHVDGNGNYSQKVICGYNGVRALRSCKGANQQTACGLAGGEGCAVCPGFPIAENPPRTDITWTNNTCNWKTCKWVGQNCSSDAECCGDWGETLDCYEGACLMM